MLNPPSHPSGSLCRRNARPPLSRTGSGRFTSVVLATTTAAMAPRATRVACSGPGSARPSPALVPPLVADPGLEVLKHSPGPPKLRFLLLFIRPHDARARARQRERFKR